MSSLDCRSATACPSCWNFQAGRCALADLLNEALTPSIAPPIGVRGLALA